MYKEMIQGSIFESRTDVILRKNIKNQYIRLRPDGGVQVSVPSYLPDDAIAEFLEKSIKTL